jgi:hypothetical protein
MYRASEFSENESFFSFSILTNFSSVRASRDTIQQGDRASDHCLQRFLVGWGDPEMGRWGDEVWLIELKTAVRRI